MCQRWALPGTICRGNGFHPCQDRGSLVLQYETHVYLIENTGLYIAFYLSLCEIRPGLDEGRRDAKEKAFVYWPKFW